MKWIKSLLSRLSRTSPGNHDHMDQKAISNMRRNNKRRATKVAKSKPGVTNFAQAVVQRGVTEI